MKKTVLVLSLIVLVLILTTCDPGSYRFNSDELTESVVKVELIDYPNPDRKKFLSWVPNHTDDLLAFDNTNSSLLEELDKNRISDFIECLSGCDILSAYYTFDSPKDICLKLTYSDGNFIIISAAYKEESFMSYICKYSSEGTVSEYIGSFSSADSFNKLVNDFFNTELKTE